MPGFKFNPTAFSHTFVGNKARRWLGQIFDGLGESKIRFVVENNKNLLDYVPEQTKSNWRKQAKNFKPLFPKFTNDEVYGWIPDRWRALIESIPGGRDWGFNQIAAIRVEAMKS